jgi:hypothetical protein
MESAGGQQACARADSGSGEFIVACSKGEATAKCEFEVGSVIDGDLVYIGQLQRGGPSVIVGVWISLYGQTEKFLDCEIPVARVNALSLDTILQCTGNFQTPE